MFPNKSNGPPTADVGRPDTPGKRKRFTCSVCQRRFSRKEHLQRHQNIHNGRKPYGCTLCSYSCRRKDLLRRHNKTSHGGSTAPNEPTSEPTAPLDHENDVQRSDHIPSPVDAAEPTRQRTELRANLQPRSLASLEDDISDSSGSSFLGSQHSSHIFPNDKTLLFSHQLPALEQDSANPTSDSELGSSTRFSPASVLPDRNSMWNANRIHPYQPSSLTDRMSRMWSLQDEAHHQAADTAIFPNVSHEDWLWLIDQLSYVNLSRYPSRVGYELPSRSALSRYLHRFLKGFHLHFPIIHSQTISIRKMAPELVLAMATIGCQYCLEHHEAKKMFTLTRDIILDRVDRSQNGLDGARQLRTRTAETSGDQVSSEMINDLTHDQGFQLEACRDCRAYAWVETMQALFYLLVLATWGEESEGQSRDIATIHSLLCLLMQQQGLSETSCCLYSWESWARHESARRTKLAIFCFFSLSTVSMNVPSPILLNDLHLQLPCSTAEWEALDMVSWEMARRQSKRSLMFEQYFELLFQAETDVTACSALGSHVMIHAILQHIFYLHQVTQVSGLRGQASVEQLLSVQRALKRWRSSCGQDPDSSFTSSSPDRHIISNSVALYRLAYIRLLVNIGPARSLNEQDETVIVDRLKKLPSLIRNPLLTLAARQAMAALLPPMEQGIFLIGQDCSWSIIHAICSLEYTYILSEFLRVTSVQDLGSSLDSDEHDVLVGVKELLLEVEKCFPNGNLQEFYNAPNFLTAKVARAWATILQSAQTWGIVALIRRVLLKLAESSGMADELNMG